MTYRKIFLGIHIFCGVFFFFNYKFFLRYKKNFFWGGVCQVRDITIEKTPTPYKSFGCTPYMVKTYFKRF